MSLLSTIVARVFLQRATISQVGSLLLLLLAASIAHALCTWAREVTAQRGARCAKAALRQRLFIHLLLLGPVYTRNERTGELTATASEGIERLDAYLSRYLPQLALSVLVPLLLLAVVFPLDWVSALLLLLTAPLIPLLMMLVGRCAEAQTQRQWGMLSRMSAHFLDVVQGLTTLKLFGRSRTEQERVARISDAFRVQTMKTLRLAFLSGAVLELLASMAIGLIAVTLGVRLLNREIGFQAAFLILLLTPEFYRPLRDLGTYRHAGLEGKASAQRINEILNTPPLAQDVPAPTRQPTGMFEIEFHNVEYTYPGNEQPTLRGVKLTLPAHSCTALVGRSGAGKSTLVHLLLRQMDCTSGSITANGIPLHELPLEQWRAYVALVPQRPYLFFDTVYENIRLARPEAHSEDILQAAKLAGALGFIEHLPQGFATLVGEQGTRLSAGQAQRIALARAFLKDAPLLALDEPTPSLDPESEAAIREALISLRQQRTVLIIAHRLNTIASASQVVVLEEGRIAGTGSPHRGIHPPQEAQPWPYSQHTTEVPS